MVKIKGDLIKLAIEGNFDIIVHGCNCFCNMGAGIARTIKQKFPEAYAVDLATKEGDKAKLGNISWAQVENENGSFIIVNGYTQFHWAGKGTLADYEAIRGVFKKIKEQFSGLRIGYPAIGAGLAKGDWNIISKIIEEELEGEKHTFVEYHN